MPETTPHTVRLYIAPKSARFAAFLVDILLWALLATWIEEAAELILTEGDELVALALEFLYFWLLHARYGQTLGKRLMGIKVVSQITGTPPGLRESAVRAGIYVLIPLLPLFGWFLALLDGLQLFWDDKSRCYHDRFAGTVVVTV